MSDIRIILGIDMELIDEKSNIASEGRGRRTDMIFL